MLYSLRVFGRDEVAQQRMKIIKATSNNFQLVTPAQAGVQ